MTSGRIFRRRSGEYHGLAQAAPPASKLDPLRRC